MGADALQSNGITQRILFLFRDSTLIKPSEPLLHVRRSRLILFITLQLAGFGATFAIVQTVGTTAQSYVCLFVRTIDLAFVTAAIGFPVIILLLIPLRSAVVPLLPFTQEELAILDRPTASPFVSSIRHIDIISPSLTLFFLVDDGIGGGITVKA